MKNKSESTKVDMTSYFRMVKSEERFLLHQTEEIFSLDAPQRRNGRLLDVVPCENCPDSDLMEDSKNRDINKVLAILPSKQHEVVCNYFGIGTDVVLPLEGISLLLGINIDQVKKLKRKAIERLKSSSQAMDILRCYL